MGEKTDDVRTLRQEEIYGETMRVDTTNPPLETEHYTTGARSGDRELEGIRSEIEQTRAEMSETLNAIQHRLSPDYLREQAREKVRDATVGRAKHMAGKAGRKARSLPSVFMERMKDNPLPAALMGLGLGWLMMGGSKSRSERRYYSERHYRRYAPEGWYGVEEEEYMPESMYHAGLEEPGEGVYRTQPYYGSEGGYDVRQKAHEASGKMKETAESVKERTSETLGHARETAGEYASQVRETAQEYAGEAREKAGRMAGQVRERTGQLRRQVRERAGYYGSEIQHGAQRARSGLMEAMEDNPLMVTAATFAVGALVGLIVPETRRESKLMGEMRDELLERAEETGRETLQKVQRVAEEAQRAAKEEAGKQNLTGQDIREKAERVAEEATTAAKQESERQNLTGQGRKEEVKNTAEEAKTAAQREAKEQGLIK
jgi:ElaB/YqjD/DUF883 family membrane-anchored ribosome-binding protein